ncbi:MAG: glycosyltransferase family 4 protein, partial [Schlesneria sp.]
MSTTRINSRPMNRDTSKPQPCDIREILPSRSATSRVHAATECQRDLGTPQKSVTREYRPQTGPFSNLPGTVSSNSIASAVNKNTTAPQRVLIIASTYPKHATDNAVPWMREIHQQMSERGHQITVLAPADQGLKSHTLDGIEIRRFRYAPASIERLTHEEGTAYKIRNSYMQLLSLPYIIFGCIAAAWLVLTRKFDVVHVHSPYPNGLLGQVARFFSGAPLVIMSHAADLKPARRKNWAGLLLKQSLRAADLRIAESPDTARTVTKLSQRKCHILPCGTKVSAANTDQPQNRVAQVLFSGQLTESKGLEYLLRAVPRILEKHPAQFIIAGNGDQRSKLEKLSQTLGLGKSVKFLGLVSDAQLGNEYANCDIWVNPATVNRQGNAEGLSPGAIEAYNYLKPVVAANVGDNLDAVIDGVTGRLVPQKDSVALADAICELLADPAKRQRMGRNGFYFAQKTFSRNRIVTDLESMYREVTCESVPATTLLDPRKAFQSLHVLPCTFKRPGNTTHYKP